MKQTFIYSRLKKRLWTALVLIMWLGFFHPAVAGPLGGTYVKDGVKHIYLTRFPYPFPIINEIWEYDPDAGDDAYAKVKIHLCTQEDIEEDNGCEDGDTWCWEGDGDDPCDCDDDEDYIPYEDNPDRAILNITSLTIEKGMQEEIADEIAVVVLSRLTVRGTQEQPVSIDVGSLLQIRGSGSDIDHCQIKSGNGTYGGGLSLLQGSNFLLSNSAVTMNKAEFGAGIYINGGSNITIENTEISGNNDASRGGGLYIANASPTVRDCIIKSNIDAWQGGGIYVTGSGSPNFINTRVCDNGAQQGGGVYVGGGAAAPVFVNAMICNNLGTSWGGGFFLNRSSVQVFSSVISNNVVFGSYGGGIYGISAAATIKNTIIYGNLSNWYKDQPEEAYVFQQVYPPELLSGFSYCDIQGGGGVDSIDAPPRFAGASSQKGPDGRGADADWSLASDSPCINTGTEDELPATPHDDTDAAGNIRPYNKPLPGTSYGAYAALIRVDIGAYEYQNNPALLIDSNGNYVTGNISSSLATDEDTDLAITLFEGYYAVDVDGDPVEIVVTVFPDDVLGDDDDPALVEFGQLFQFPEGDRITSNNNTVTDSEHRLVYNPANRSESYSAFLAGSFSDGQSPSSFSHMITVSVTADNDPPYFISYPSQLQIYAGEQFEYYIRVDDVDVDEASTCSLFIETLADWLTFWDNADDTGRLLGIASSDDVGETDIVIWAEDGGGNGDSQAFTIVVDQQIDLKVEVDKTSVSGAPGDGIVLKAFSETMATNPVFDWEITDENNNTLATLKGQRVTWDTTGQAEGTYTAVVTLSDSRGSNPDSKTVTISLAVSFSEANTEIFNQADDENRKPPNQQETNTINNLDGNSPADVINDMAALDLDPDQRDKVVGAIADKSDDDLTEEDTNNLLNALDNLIIANPTDPADRLTTGQVDQALESLENLADNPNLTDMQKAELAKILDDLITQQGGRDNLSSDQLALVESLEAKIYTFDSLNGNSPADVINSMSALDLSPDQRGKVVAAIADKSDNDLTEEEANDLLGALDNLIIADPTDADDYLTDEETDQALEALKNLSANPELTDMQLAKLAETVDELIAQQGRENLSDDQLAAIEVIQGNLIRIAAGLDRPMTAGGEYFSLASQPVNEATGAGPLTIKTGNATVIINDVDELKNKLGFVAFCIILTHNAASTLAEVPVYTLGLYTTSGELISFDDELDTPLEIALPISDDFRIRPMYYDKLAGQWSNTTIYKVASGEAEVSFKATRFRDYGLFRSSLITPEDATSVDAAGGGGRGSSNCFLQTILP